MTQLKCCSTITIASEWLLSFYFILSWLVPRLNCFQMNKTPSICVFPSVREKKKSTYCDKEIGFICVDFCSKECNNFAGTEIPILSVFN